jgi:uncharacterized protein (DUF2132 family)
MPIGKIASSFRQNRKTSWKNRKNQAKQEKRMPAISGQNNALGNEFRKIPMSFMRLEVAG